MNMCCLRGLRTPEFPSGTRGAQVILCSLTESAIEESEKGRGKRIIIAS